MRRNACEKNLPVGRALEPGRERPERHGIDLSAVAAEGSFGALRGAMGKKTSKSHENYLSSRAWLERSATFRETHANCIRCGMSEKISHKVFGQSLNVHHLSYQRAKNGMEFDEDLESRCAFCHALVSTKCPPDELTALEAQWLRSRNRRMASIAVSISMWSALANGRPVLESLGDIHRNMRDLRQHWGKQDEANVEGELEFLDAAFWFVRGFRENLQALDSMLAEIARLSPSARKFFGGTTTDFNALLGGPNCQQE